MNAFFDSAAPKAWMHKAKALDRYRWALLRARHGVAGSLIRLLRDAVVDIRLGVVARLRSEARFESSSRAVIVLHGSPKLLGMQRKKGLVQALGERGHQVLESAIEPLADAVRQGKICSPAQRVPLRYYAYAAYAEWLSRKNNPLLILSERNGSLVSPFLRLSLNAQGKKLAHLAHATTVESSQRLSMTDYDSYFLFGPSSLAALSRRPLRFGDTQVVLAGSHLIDESYDMPPAEPGLARLLVLGVGPDKEKRDGYLSTYLILRDWASSHPNTLVSFKSHPRSKATFWLEAASKLGNVQVLPKKMSLAKALEQANVVVNIMSNASLEAALAQRPVVYVNASGDSDILEQSRFFGPEIADAEALEQRLDWVSRHYEQALEQSRAFVNYHLAYGVNGQKKTADMIDQLVRGAKVDSVVLEGTVC